MKYHFSAESSAWAQKVGLGILNTLCDIHPTYPVSGDGTVDLWTFERVYMGLRLSCALASSGDKEEAYAALEDVVELCEKFAILPDGTELSFRCHTFGDAKAKIKWERTRTAKKEWVSAELDVYDDEKPLIYISFTIPDVPTREHGWEWFDPIRNEDRYKALAKRLEAARAKLEASVK